MDLAPTSGVGGHVFYGSYGVPGVLAPETTGLGDFLGGVIDILVPIMVISDPFAVLREPEGT